MHEEFDQKLERLTKMVEEDHQMIRSLYTRARINSILRIIYLILIVGAAVGAYYFIEPYLTKVMEIYNSVKNTQANFNPQGIFEWFTTLLSHSTSSPR